MWSITLRLMKKNAKMLIPAGIAIMIGTAFIAATFLFGNAMEDSLTTQMTAQYGRATHVVSQKDEDEVALPEGMTPTVGDFNIDSMRAIDGVEDVRVMMQTEFTVATQGKKAHLYVESTAADAALLPVSIVKGSQPKGAGQIALPEGIAKDLHVGVGQSVQAKLAAADVPDEKSGGSAPGASREAFGEDASGKPEDGGSSDDAVASRTSSPENAGADLKVVGLTRDDTGLYGAFGGAAIVSDDVLVRSYGVTSVNRIPVDSATVLVKINPAKFGTAPAAIKKLLPKGYSLSTRQALADGRIRKLSKEGTSVVTTFLLCFAILAMFVAALVIANTFQVMVAQRRRTLALLRAIGAKKGQLYRSVLTEAGLLGVISSILGIVLGVALMELMCGTKWMNASGAPLKVVVTPPVIWVPLVFGVIVTVLASISSARSATSVTPLEALQPFEAAASRKAGRVRAFLGILMLVAGLVLCFAAIRQMPGLINGSGASQKDSSNTYDGLLLSAIAGCALIFLALAIMAVFWLPWIMKGVGSAISHCGPSANVASANIQKNPRRVAATGLALLIGVTLVSTIATGAASGKRTINESLDSHYSVDMSADGDGLDRAAAREIAVVKGVSKTLYMPAAIVQIKGDKGLQDADRQMLLVGVDSIESLRSVLRLNLSRTTLDDGSVLLPQISEATGHKLTVEEKVVFQSADLGDEAKPNGKSLVLKSSQLDYRRVSGSTQPVGFVTMKHFRNGDLHAQSHLLIGRLVDPNDMTVFKEIQASVSNNHVQISGPAVERQRWNKTIESIMLLIVGLLAVAVLIALIGVANTLSLSVIERTKESATLRAIGMTRGQLKRSLAIEALLISLVNAVLGVMLGTGFGWLGAYMVFSLYGKVSYPFNWKVNGIMLIVAVLAALFASVLPARRAVKTPPVEALAEA